MTSPYHPGELHIQHAAGLHEDAAHVAQIIHPRLSGSAALFLSRTETIVLAGLDRSGRCWTSARAGQPGFVRTTSDHLHITGGLRTDDPLAALGPGDPVGTIAIDMAHRRRLRVNGSIEAADRDRIVVVVREAYGNCPKYIDTRGRIEPLPPGHVADRTKCRLTAADKQLLEESRTFFIGSIHPQRGADASHRGGDPGFVEVKTSNELRFPDYPGNAMFNTLGNVFLDPRVGLLFVGPAGDRLQITGAATIEFHQPSTNNPEGRTIIVRVDDTVRWTDRPPPSPASSCGSPSTRPWPSSPWSRSA